MTVAHGEQRSVNKYWEVDDRARPQLLVVHIATERPWLLGRQAAPLPRRRYAEISKERSNGELLSPGHSRGALLPVDRNVDAPQARKILGQGAEQGHLQVPTPLLAQPDL